MENSGRLKFKRLSKNPFSMGFDVLTTYIVFYKKKNCSSGNIFSIHKRLEMRISFFLQFWAFSGLNGKIRGGLNTEGQQGVIGGNQFFYFSISNDSRYLGMLENDYENFGGEGVEGENVANVEKIANVTLFGKTEAISISSINILCSHYVPELIAWVVCNINLECIAKEF